MLLVLFDMQSGFAQTIKGKYYSANDSFAVEIDPNFRPNFIVLNPCQGGYCAVYHTDGYFIIDTLGNMIIPLNKHIKKMKIVATPTSVYQVNKTWSHNYELIRFKGPPLNYVSKWPLIYLYSDTMGDYFFQEMDHSYHYNLSKATGNIIRFTQKKIDTISQNQHFITSNKVGDDPSNLQEYFPNGLLISPLENGEYKVTGPNLQPLFTNFEYCILPIWTICCWLSPIPMVIN